MAISITCPQCGIRNNAGDELANQAIHCLNCGALLREAVGSHEFDAIMRQHHAAASAMPSVQPLPESWHDDSSAKSLAKSVRFLSWAVGLFVAIILAYMGITNTMHNRDEMIETTQNASITPQQRDVAISKVKETTAVWSFAFCGSAILALGCSVVFGEVLVKIVLASQRSS